MQRTREPALSEDEMESSISLGKGSGMVWTVRSSWEGVSSTFVKLKVGVCLRTDLTRYSSRETHVADISVMFSDALSTEKFGDFRVL